jgi:hypothetical protein
MPDLLIRDVPEDVVAEIDTRARELGLSRTEYLRRQLSRDARRTRTPVSVGDLQRFAGLTADLSDTDVMGAAWS